MPRTEVTLITGKTHVVDGDLETVEKQIVGAARGSIMQMARLAEADSGAAFSINPEHVVALREIGAP